MVEIEFLGPIGLESLKVEAKNLGEVKAALSEKEELKKWQNFLLLLLYSQVR